MPNERANIILSTVHLGREAASFWQQVVSSPTDAIIVPTGALVRAFAVAWPVPPPHQEAFRRKVLARDRVFASQFGGQQPSPLNALSMKWYMRCEST